MAVSCHQAPPGRGCRLHGSSDWLSHQGLRGSLQVDPALGHAVRCQNVRAVEQRLRAIRLNTGVGRDLPDQAEGLSAGLPHQLSPVVAGPGRSVRERSRHGGTGTSATSGDMIKIIQSKEQPSADTLEGSDRRISLINQNGKLYKELQHSTRSPTPVGYVF